VNNNRLDDSSEEQDRKLRLIRDIIAQQHNHLNLSREDLSSANLISVDLSFVNLSFAKLNSANLSKANLN